MAFPTGDANSLSKNILMYACTLTEGASAEEQGRMVQRVSHSASASASLGSNALAASLNPRPGISPAVMMVSKHVDGSLNQVKDCYRKFFLARDAPFPPPPLQNLSKLSHRRVHHVINVLLTPVCSGQ